MVAITDTKDGGGLQEWLQSQPQYVTAIIAHRLAMRVLPVYWKWATTSSITKKSIMNELPYLRKMLIVDVFLTQKHSNVSSAIKEAVFSAADAGTYNPTTTPLRASTSCTIAGLSIEIYAKIIDAQLFSDTYSKANMDAPVALSRTIAGFAKGWGDVEADVISKEILEDCASISNGVNLKGLNYWIRYPSFFRDEWAITKRLLTGGDIDWSFWIKWYQAALDGQPLNPEMLERIALIEPEAWEKGPEHLNGLIAKIEAEFAPSGSSGDHSIKDLLGATLFDFTFDQLENIMRAIPMPEDWKHLEDPEYLEPFLEDAADVCEGFELLSKALAAEGRGMQGAGAVKTYLDAVLEEFGNAKDVGKLKVSALLEYGNLLEGMAQDEPTKAEFGLLTPALEQNVNKLRDLLRKHFSNTLARFTVLRDLEMEEEADPWEVLLAFRDIVSKVESGGDGQLPALAKGDVAVLSDVLDSVERLLRSIDGSSSENSKSSMRREVSFQLAKVGATA